MWFQKLGDLFSNKIEIFFSSCNSSNKNHKHKSCKPTSIEINVCFIENYRKG